MTSSGQAQPPVPNRCRTIARPDTAIDRLFGQNPSVVVRQSVYLLRPQVGCPGPPQINRRFWVTTTASQAAGPDHPSLALILQIRDTSERRPTALDLVATNDFWAWQGRPLCEM